MLRTALILALFALCACARDATPPADATPVAPSPAADAAAPAAPAAAPAPPVSTTVEGEADDPDAIPPIALAPVRADLGNDLGELRYFGRAVDLGGDGRSEVVVQVAGPGVCGTGGCTTYVLAQDAQGAWSIISTLSVTQAPVAVAATRTHGWRDLIVAVGGGGGESGFAKVTFDGTTYASNPTTVPGPLLQAAPAGAVVVVPRFGSLSEGLPLP